MSPGFVRRYKEIVIQLRDRSEYRHPGPVADVVVQGLTEAYLGKGPIREACLNSDQISISQDPRTRDHLVELLRCAGHFEGVTKENSTPAGGAAVGAARPERGDNAGGTPGSQPTPLS
jgi:hypothetical protein